MMVVRPEYLWLVVRVSAIGLVALWLTGCRSGEPLGSGRTVPIIFDTDIGTDVDDAGALAILHVMADRGEARILATMSANRNRWCAPALDAINTYYGRPDLPIGCSRTGPDPEEWYRKSVGDFPHDLTHSDQAPEAVTLYRQILAAQPDNSVTIVVVGWLTNMAELLDSRPDQYSPLTGRELVQAKVKELVSMGGTWPNSPKDEGEYNFTMDLPAAHKVIRDWPGRIMFTGLGKDVMTGGRLVAQAPKDNPVPAFYRNFFEVNKVSARSSWDLIAVLYAVRGLSKYFTAVSDGKCVSQENGTNQWLPNVPSNHAYLAYRIPPTKLAAVIEDLLSTPPLRVSGGRATTVSDDTEGGELTIYKTPTSVGTVAKRVFRDSSGRMSKMIHYRSGPSSFAKPVTEKSLQVCSVVMYRYDEQGREYRQEHYDPDMKLHRIMDTHYQHGGKVIVWRRPDETRDYEIRQLEGHSTSHLYFDDSGQQLMGVRGPIPSDVDLAWGWGRPVDGLVCGIGVNRTSGSLREMRVFVTVRNLTESPMKTVIALQYHLIQVQMRDAKGALVPQNTEYIAERNRDLTRVNRGANESIQTLPAQEAYTAGYELAEWYGGLPSGKYYLTVTRRAAGRDFSLVSNTLEIEIQGEIR